MPNETVVIAREGAISSFIVSPHGVRSYIRYVSEAVYEDSESPKGVLAYCGEASEKSRQPNEVTSNRALLPEISP